MSSPFGATQSEVLHDSKFPCEEVAAGLVAMLDETPPLTDPAELEHLAALMLSGLEAPAVPGELGTTVIAAIEKRHDANAAAVLAALAALAVEPLAAQARGSADRLAGEGVVSGAAAAVGSLTIEESVQIEIPGAELLCALLTRPGAHDVQTVILGIERADTGGALIECTLTPPGSRAEAHELLDSVDGLSDPQPVASAELTARASAAARRACELDVALGSEAGLALPIVSRALTGDPAALPRPAVLAPWEDEDPELVVDAAEDEEGFHRVTEMLLEELEEHARATHPPGGVVWQHGDFVATTMLDWKGSYDDGRLGHWTPADLAEYLLDYFPRKVSADEETLAAVPECVCAFLGFLDARGSLSGTPLEQLEQACEALREDFDECARDGSRWGPAKSMVMGMPTEVFEPSAPGPTALPGAQAPKKQSKRRKAQRDARKRNRRG